MGSLPPAFKKGGTITAANASSISDGAAAVVLAAEAAALTLGLKPLGYITGSAALPYPVPWSRP